MAITFLNKLLGWFRSVDHQEPAVISNISEQAQREFADKSAPIRSEPWRGLDSITRRDEPTADHIAATTDAVVATVSQKIANAIVRLPVIVNKIIKVDNETRFEPDHTHPVMELFDEPNPYCSWPDMITFIVKSLILTGNTWLGLDFVGGEPVEMWKLEPDKVKAKYDDRGRPFEWIYGDAHNKIPYGINEIIHFRITSVSDMVYGRSLVEPLHQQILQQYWINKYNKAFFKNGAHITKAFVPDSPIKDPDILEQFQRLVNAKHGGTENAHKFFISNIPGKWESLSSEHKDLDFQFLQTFNREMIFSLFGVPPAEAGILEDANYSNMYEQKKLFWTSCIQPILTILEAEFNRQLIWRHFARGGKDDFVMNFDISNVQALQEDANVAAETDCMLVNAGIMTIDEVRTKRGLAPLPEQPEPENPIPDQDKDTDANDSPPQEKDNDKESDDGKKGTDKTVKNAIDRLTRDSNRIRRGNNRLICMLRNDPIGSRFGGGNGTKRKLYD